MTREEAKALLPVIQAYAEGKTVQVRVRNDSRDRWEDYPKHRDCAEFDNTQWEWRIKPEPREWWLLERSDGTIFGPYYAEPSAGAGERTIHVREVL